MGKQNPQHDPCVQRPRHPPKPPLERARTPEGYFRVSAIQNKTERDERLEDLEQRLMLLESRLHLINLPKYGSRQRRMSKRVSNVEDRLMETLLAQEILETDENWMPPGRIQRAWEPNNKSTEESGDEGLESGEEVGQTQKEELPAPKQTLPIKNVKPAPNIYDQPSPLQSTNPTLDLDFDLEEILRSMMPGSQTQPMRNQPTYFQNHMQQQQVNVPKMFNPDIAFQSPPQQYVPAPMRMPYGPTSVVASGHKSVMPSPASRSTSRPYLQGYRSQPQNQQYQQHVFQGSMLQTQSPASFQQHTQSPSAFSGNPNQLHGRPGFVTEQFGGRGGVSGTSGHRVANGDGNTKGRPQPGQMGPLRGYLAGNRFMGQRGQRWRG